MANVERQQGMTFISTLLLLIVAGFFVLLLLKVGPIYLENYKIKNILSTLESEPGMAGRSRREILSLLDKRLYINEVRHLTPKDIKLKREGEVLRVQIDYTAKEHIIGNVDVLVTFSDRAELSRR